MNFKIRNAYLKIILLSSKVLLINGVSVVSSLCVQRVSCYASGVCGDAGSLL